MSENINLSKSKYSFNQKIFFLYILNIVDWICTEALLKSGLFQEANPVMKPVFGGFWTTVLIKGVLPLCVVLLCSLVYKWAGNIESKAIDVLLYIGITAYVLVIIWHILNFLLLFLIF